MQAKEKYNIIKEDPILSDIAFFLSVMKNEGAFRMVLGIILERDIVKLEDIKVENVILNEEGKRGYGWMLGQWRKMARSIIVKCKRIPIYFQDKASGGLQSRSQQVCRGELESK